jgi:hypothetical protein
VPGRGPSTLPPITHKIVSPPEHPILGVQPLPPRQSPGPRCWTSMRKSVTP